MEKGEVSDHGRVMRAMLLVLLFVGVSKIIGAAKEMAVAAVYGTGPVADSYALVFNILSWPQAVMASVFMSVLVPFLVRTKANEKSGRLLMGELLGSTILVALPTMLLIAAATFFGLMQGAAELPDTTAEISRQILFPMALLVPLGFVSSLLAANLMARHSQINTLVEAVPALCILIIVLVWSDASAMTLVWATLIGAILQMALLEYLQPMKAKFWPPKFTWNAPEWRLLISGLGIVLFGQAIASFTGVVDQIMVAPLGQGANASLGYANRVVALVMGLGATSIGRALLPVLTEIGLLDRRRASDLALRWAGLLFALGLLAAAVAYAASPWAIGLLFQRGAFTDYDTQVVSEIFRYGIVQVPFYFAGIVFAQLIASRADYRKFLYVGVINFGVKISGNLIFIPLFQVRGVMIATCLMYAVSFPVLWLFSRK